MDVGKVAMIEMSSIEIGARARHEMGDLDGLEESMKSSGAISPIAVKESNNDNKPYVLLAGERRLTVLVKNHNGKIPARIYPEDISELEVAVIELAENFHRKDLEFWEYDSKTREIHKLQQEIHGEKISTLSDASGWGMKDTAQTLGKSKGTVSTAIKRADARDAFPDLFAKCKNQNDASKIIDRMDEAIIRDSIAQKIERGSLNQDKQQLINNFVLKDFFEGALEIHEKSIHLMEIDPPYGINLDGSSGASAKKNYTYGNSYNEVSIDDYSLFMQKTLKTCYNIMAEHSWLIVWFAPEPWFCDIHKWITNAGFSTTRMCGIWTKGTGQSKRPEMHLANTYEMFFYAWKGRPAIAKQGRANEFNFAPVPHQQKVHPTERPIELMKEIYETFAFPGSRVGIPFLGSGNGLFAAKLAGMSGVGFELSKAYRDSFLVRVNNM